MKQFVFFLLSLLVSQCSCKAQKDNHFEIIGEWSAIELVNMVSFERSDLEELKMNCIAANWDILKDSIVARGNSECDFKGCGKTNFKSIYLNVVKANNVDLKHLGQEIYEGKISLQFLDQIGYNKAGTRIRAYDAACNISWGEEPLKIIPVNRERIVFLIGAYYLVLNRVKVN